jgi:exodeoxyribonuclease-3
VIKFVSWNVNGLRACMGKGFMEFFLAQDADYFMVQETKLQSHQIALDLPGYVQIFHDALKPGYSGTAIFAKREPLNLLFDFGDGLFGGEGRVITAETEDFCLVNAYAPNAQDGLKRLSYRVEWEQALRDHLKNLRAKKPVVYCGDLNVAHNEIDLKHPKQNRLNAGFSDEERACMTELLGCGFVDTFRHLYPETVDAYTWWSYRFNARATNAGWRIDYFIVSDDIRHRIAESRIHADVFGSDHCPVSLELL